MQKTGRLVQILLLLQAYGSLTAQEIADKCEVSIRTVYRDIEALTLWGVPLIGESGHGGGYSLPENYTVDPKMFTGKEVSLLGAGSALIQGFTDFIGDPKELEVATAKLLAVLSEEEKLVALRQLRFILFDRSRWYRDYVYMDILKELRNAVVHNFQVILNFHERDDKSISEVNSAQVDPYGLVYKSDTWYLVGYSHVEKLIRRWNLIRIVKVEILQTDFNRPTDFSLRDWWVAELEAFGKGNLKVLLQIDKVAWSRFKRVHWKKDNRFYDMGTHIIVELMVNTTEWLIDMVMVNRGDVEVLEPVDLREKIARSARRMFERHAQETATVPSENHVVDFEILSLAGDDLE